MKPVLIALLLTLPIYIKGQVCLSDILPASADSLDKCRIRHFTPGKGEESILFENFVTPNQLYKETSQKDNVKPVVDAKDKVDYKIDERVNMLKK